MLLPAKLLLFPEEKENKSTKNVKMLKETLFANFPESGFRSNFWEISYISAFSCVKKNLPRARCSYGKRGKYVVARISGNFHFSKFFTEKMRKTHCFEPEIKEKYA